MLSHPDDVVTLWEVEHQELMRDAARDRLAASAQRHAPSWFARVRTAAATATCWLNGQMQRRAAHHGQAAHLAWPGMRRWRVTAS